ncbi:protein SSUH2 homolog [Leptodactylus fuscus]
MNGAAEFLHVDLSGDPLSSDYEKSEPPPPYLPPDSPADPAEVSFTIPSYLISEDDARQALLLYIQKKRFTSSRPAQGMTLRSLQPFNTFRYRLESFTETRICKWAYDPYSGGQVDGPDNGPSPDPWTLQAKPTFLFVDAEHCMPLPHTSSVERCPDCRGVGKVSCTVCSGTGRKTCMACGGLGRGMNRDSCGYCHGRGSKRCFHCDYGKIKCSTCSGKRQVIKYIQVKVKWENHKSEFIADHKSDFTTELFADASGEIAFSHGQQTASPVTSFPDTSINEASENLIREHQAKFTYCKIMRQRQTIEWLPLTKVNYIWNGEEYNYYVYGTQNKVFTKKYPKSCCCCVVM